MHQRSLTNDLQHYGYLFTVLLCFQAEVCYSQTPSIEIKPPKPTVGQSVLLLLHYTDEIFNINWYRGQGTKDSMNILTHSPGSPYPPTKGPLYTGRETVMENGTLQISNLMTNYSGFYTVEITSPTALQHWSAELSVYSSSGSDYSTTAFTQLYPANNITYDPNQAKDSKIVIPVGIAVAVIAAIGLIIAAVIIWKKKCFKKSNKPIYEDEKISSFTIPQNRTSEENLQPIERRLPTIPPRNDTGDYQNEITFEEEHPYTDLNYIYLSSSYLDLRKENK